MPYWSLAPELVCHPTRRDLHETGLSAFVVVFEDCFAQMRGSLNTAMQDLIGLHPIARALTANQSLFLGKRGRVTIL